MICKRRRLSANFQQPTILITNTIFHVLLIGIIALILTFITSITTITIIAVIILISIIFIIIVVSFDFQHKLRLHARDFAPVAGSRCSLDLHGQRRPSTNCFTHSKGTLLLRILLLFVILLLLISHYYSY